MTLYRILARRLPVAAVLLALTAQAHSPFASSARLIVHESTLEIALTVGMGGGQTLLQGGPPEALRIRSIGPGEILPLEFAQRWFELAAGSEPLKADRVVVRTDGLEVDIVLEYSKPGESMLALDALYVTKLPGSFKSAFVMTDEVGNVLATRALSSENHTFELAMPSIVTAVESAENPGPAMAPPLAHELTTTVASASISIPAVTFNQPVPPANSVLGFGDYLKLGIEHILSGYDHLLFLCGLLVVCRRVKPMLAIITCFTLAHSVTLALAALELVSISPRLTEPLIAATIIFVGVENLRARVDTKSRCGLALGFGLIHGFGFATALRETGLAGTGAPLVQTLFAFNLGVECGQLAVAAVLFPLLLRLRKFRWFERNGVRAVSVLVVGLGAFWLGQRILF